MPAINAHLPHGLLSLVTLALLFLSGVPAWGATAYLPPDGVAAHPSTGARGGAPVAAPRMARTHILVELGQGVDETGFLERARGQGLRRLGRVHGTRWLTMSIPAGATPHGAAAAARGFPGVVHATPDILVEAYHHVLPVDPPYVDDPLYIYDDDPTTKPDCDPCTVDQFVDQWGLFRVDTESGWNTETGGVNANGDEIVIAIVDSGMDLDHDDLRDNLWVNPNEHPDGIDNDGNGLIDDLHGADFVGTAKGGPGDDPASKDANPDIPDWGTWVEDWSAPWLWRFDGDPATGDALDNNNDFFIDLGVFHGTFVAGIAAAATDNVNPETSLYEGIAGACWNCKLMPVRMIDAEGGGLISNAASAIRYAADQGADIINASWGVGTNGLDPADVEILRQAVDYAVGKGVIVVAASGNGGTAGISFPGAMANTIAVGSSDWTDARSPFSSYGYAAEIPDDGIDNDGNGWVDDVVDVVAPGETIWSTAVISAYDAFILNGWDWYCCADLPPNPDDWHPGEDAYTASDGTSFATPLVAGYIGVLLSANCGASPSEVRHAIRTNALDVGLPDYDAQTGFGRLQFVVPTDLGSGGCGGSGDNVSPTANAGSDRQVIDQAKPREDVTLNGGGSFDPDGNIFAYVWRENGVVVANGATPTMTLGVGVHDIVLTVTDDGGATGSDAVRVEVCKKSCSGSGSEAPIAQDDAYNIAAAEVTLNVAVPGVLQNDSDPNGDALTAMLVSGPANASAFTLNPDGSFSYTHDGSATTSDSFNYRAWDGSLASDAATVTITVGSGDTNAMYMEVVDFQMKGRALNVTVTVRHDADADGNAESSDAGVGSAVVHGTLCSLTVPGMCHFVNSPIGTGGNGKATYKLFGASGQYEYRWTSIVHETYTWDPSLDTGNPAVGP